MIFWFSDRISQFWYFFCNCKLLGTDRGNIYEIDFIEIKRYNEIFPYKTFTNIRNNILELFKEENGVSMKKSEVMKKSLGLESIERSIERMSI